MKFNKRNIKKIFSILVGVVLLLSIYLNTYLIVKYNVLPFKYLMVYFVIVGLIPFILIFFTVFRRIKPWLRGILTFLEFIYIILLFFVFGYLNQTFHFLDEFTKGFDYETKNYYVLTLNDSEYDDIKDLENKTIGYTSALDVSAEHALSELNNKVTLNKIEIDGFSQMLEKLNQQEIDSILIIQGYYDLLTEDDEELKQNTKIVYKYSIREKVESLVKDVDVTKETFNIYISGIDSYDDVTIKTRSDVNIVMSINPVTNKILMINIPRDYYVEFDGIGKKDKLTHAGMYGVETSVKTIENLLDIEINYYVKVNYTALINLVDALGGVNVYSKYAFTTHDYRYKIQEGYNYVNGKKALDFARTRKAFAEGDRVRGENQQALIKAIIEKAMDASILLKYDDILKSLEGYFTTNISTDKIMSVINMQLDAMPKWSFESISLNGTDAMGPSAYYEGQQLYVMIPDEKTIANAKEALNTIK